MQNALTAIPSEILAVDLYKTAAYSHTTTTLFLLSVGDCFMICRLYVLVFCYLALEGRGLVRGVVNLEARIPNWSLLEANT